MPVEGTIDTYPLHRSAYNASCACWQVDLYCFVERSCVESWFVGHANLEEVGTVGSVARLWRVDWSLWLVGSVDKAPDVSSAAFGCDR